MGGGVAGDGPVEGAAGGGEGAGEVFGAFGEAEELLDVVACGFYYGCWAGWEVRGEGGEGVVVSEWVGRG